MSPADAIISAYRSRSVRSSSRMAMSILTRIPARGSSSLRSGPRSKVHDASGARAVSCKWATDGTLTPLSNATHGENGFKRSGQEINMNALVRLTVTVVTVAACLAGLAGCGGSRGIDKALAEDTKKTPVAPGNSHAFDAPLELTLRVVAGTLVQKGFSIDQADSNMGFIKATRNMPDPKDANTNYHMSATAYVSAQHSGRTSLVTLSVSQQTVLHRSGHSWGTIPLLPLPIPIPTGKTYETVVTGEGGLKGDTFYNDFFAAVQQGLMSATEFGAPTLAADAEKPATAPVQSTQAASASGSDPRKDTGPAPTPPAAGPAPHL
jgi:hypothetical protein